MPLVIRAARNEDLSAWAAMRSELWPESSAAEHMSSLQDELQSPKLRGFVADQDGTLIGFAEAYIRDFANGCDSRPVVFLEGVWVRESSRSQGVGRSLLAAVEAWARELGILEIGSDAYTDNALSQLCHAKWGFEETQRVVYFKKRLGTD